MAEPQQAPQQSPSWFNSLIDSILAGIRTVTGGETAEEKRIKEEARKKAAAEAAKKRAAGVQPRSKQVTPLRNTPVGEAARGLALGDPSKEKKRLGLTEELLERRKKMQEALRAIDKE